MLFQLTSKLVTALMFAVGTTPLRVASNPKLINACSKLGSGIALFEQLRV